jgi:hypothetical protein
MLPAERGREQEKSEEVEVAHPWQETVGQRPVCAKTWNEGQARDRSNGKNWNTTTHTHTSSGFEADCTCASTIWAETASPGIG